MQLFGSAPSQHHRGRAPQLRKLVGTLVVAICLVPFVVPTVAVATVDGQRQEVERIVDELDRLHEQADILAEDYNEAIGRQSELDIEIVDAQASVAAKEAELVVLRGDLAAGAVQAFTGSGTDVLGPLFSNAEAYSDDLRGEQFSQVALDVGAATSDDLDELISDLEEARSDLQAMHDEVAQLTVTIAEKQTQTADRLKDYTKARADAEAKLGTLIRQEEERRAAKALADLQAKYRASQNSGGGNSGGGNSGGGSGGGNSGNQSGDTSGGGSSGGDSSGGDSSGGGGGDSGGGGGGYTPPVSGLAGVAISSAHNQLGVPYRYATSNPGESFDCSGLTSYAWAQAGVSLPRNSRSQAASLPRIPPGNAQPGDLIFYYSPISHVGLYLGNSSMIHAPATGDVVKISGVNWDKVTAVGRPG